MTGDVVAAVYWKDGRIFRYCGNKTEKKRRRRTRGECNEAKDVETSSLRRKGDDGLGLSRDIIA